MPANSVCPTITFPTRAEREREEAALRAQAAERAALEDAARKQAAAREQADREELDAAMQRLAQLAPAAGTVPAPPAFRAVDDALDETVQAPALAPPGDGGSDKVSAPFWTRVGRWLDKAVTSLPGCRSDLFDRNLCRMVLFGPFGMPPAMDDIRTNILDTTQSEAQP